MIKRIKKLPVAVQHSLVYALALALSKGLALVMVPVATHFLTPEDYGRLDVLQTLADLLSIVIGMGLAECVFRFAGSADSEDEKRTIIANVFGMALCLGVLALLIGQILAGWISTILPGSIPERETRMILASLSMVGTIIVPLACMRMQNKPWSYFLGTAGRVALQVLIAVPLLFMGFGVLGVLTATLLSAILMCLWLVRKQWQDTGIRFEFAQFKSFSLYGGPLIFVGISGFILGSFDRWVLADSVGTAEMAQYALAAKFGLITAVLIQPFDLWWHAKRFSCLKETNGPDKCARIATLGISLAILSALIISAVGPVLVRLLTPETYHQSIQYIPWLAALAAIHNINSTLNFGAMSQKSTLRPAIIDGISAFIAFVGYLVLIPPYSAWGAIGATSLALTVRLIATYQVSQRTLFLPYRTRRIVFMALSGVMALICMPSSELTITSGSQITALIFSFILSCLLLGTVRLPGRIAKAIRQTTP